VSSWLLTRCCHSRAPPLLRATILYDTGRFCRTVKAKAISGVSLDELKKQREQSAAARATVRAKALRYADHACVGGGSGGWGFQL
jgi:hypothetical protein